MKQRSSMPWYWLGVLSVGLAVVALTSCSGGGSDDVAGPDDTIAVALAGNGTGRVVANFGGVDCPGNCGPKPYTNGESVLLSATPDQGSSLGGWTGDCTPDPGQPLWCVVHVNGHMEITATFVSP